MTDFYTVLRNALSRVGAADADERDRIYGHVRAVMAQKLRDLDPPLDEEVVEDRLVTFDAAIERIEGEFRERERQVETADSVSESHTAEWSAGDAYETDARNGAQERTAGGGWNGLGSGETAEAERGAPVRRPDIDIPSTDPRWGRSGPARGNGRDDEKSGAFARRQDQAAGNGAIPDDAPAYWAASGGEQSTPAPSRPGAEPPAAGWAARLRSGRIFGDSAVPADDAIDSAIDDDAIPGRRSDADPIDSDGHRVDRDDPIAALARGLRKNGAAGRRAEPPLMASADDADAFPVEVRPYVEDDADVVTTSRRERRAQARAAAREARAERANPSRRRIWVLVILLFGAVVVGWAASVFIPILFPEAPSEETADVPTEADPVGAADAGPAPVVRDAGEAAPALPPAPAAQPVQIEPIVLFDGTDPGAFVGGPNAVQFQAGANGGFVTVTSTIASGGARVTVGPDIAAQIAGHTVRVLLDVRGTPGQPAGMVSLSYQHGTTGLQTRQAIVSEIFGAVAATWAVPAGADGSNDYLLIEPGVPGDGTAIDIQSVRIVVVN